MDELLRHCLRELSFDGDLGCDVGRLRDFVVDFYAHGTNADAQNTDDAFCAFVWSLVVQQPTVIVGIFPEGVTSEVWIAPQISAKRKAKAKGEELVEVAPARLTIVPDAKKRTLEDLKAEYGDSLRIATDPDATYAAVTGTHIRFPKMSPMVYSALQIITRGRDNGVSVVELGQKSKYDQKTCFYLVRQLTELDLVVKVRRGGVGTNFCIHKYFYERSPSWRAIQDEETRATAAETEESSAALAPTDSSLQQEDDNPPDPPELPGLDFSPIDARHLSSMPLVKSRIIKLLKASKNFMHASNNMLIAIGFAHPTKTDRRFFASRTRELVDQGVLENVYVPGKLKRSPTAAGVKCFRLVSADSDSNSASAQGAIVVPPDDVRPGDQSCVKANVTIHKQIISLIEESGTVGMTLNELAAALCHFDKRTIELLLSRTEKFPPPSHLSDLGIAGLMETSGRERRNRYYTIASYQALVAREKLDQDSTGYTDIDLSKTGGFFPVSAESFYTDLAALAQHQDRDAKLSRPPTNSARKKPAAKNPVLPDGTVKKGRPRKELPEGEVWQPRKRKRKIDGEDEAEKAAPSKKRRKKESADEASVPDAADPNADTIPNDTPPAPPKRRGRPPKKAPVTDVPETAGADPDPANAPTPPAPKKRGRPPKNPAPVVGEDDPQPPKKRGRPKKDSEAEPPKKRGRKSEPKPAEEAITHADTKEPEPELEPAKAPTPPPASLAEAAHVVPPVVMIPAADSSPIASAAPSSPLTELENSEFGDEDLVEPTSPTLDLVTSKQPPSLDLPPVHDPMEMDLQEVDGYKSPVHSTEELGDSMLMSVSDTPQHPETSEPYSGLLVIDAPAIKPKVNVSTLRRENELFRILQDLGGMLNTQVKEMYTAHEELLVTLTKAGEPTSAPPGTRLDRRTAHAAFNNLELRGRVKQLKTTITSLTGLVRPANIVYLPEIEESRIKAYIAEQGRNSVHILPQMNNGIVVDEHTEYGYKSVRATRKPSTIPVQLLQIQHVPGERRSRFPNSNQAEELFSYDEETVREVLLTERTTLGQMYGYIPAKLIRTREVHLHTLDLLENTPSSNVVSREKRIVNFPFFWTDIPVGLHCAIVAVLEGSDDLYNLLSTEDGRKTPVKDIPSSIFTLLQVGRTRGRGRFLELLDILRSLGLAIPLERCDDGTPLITCAPSGTHPTAYKEATSVDWHKDATLGAPDYWYFTSHAPVHHWARSEQEPPFLKEMSLASCADAVEYWELLRMACSDFDLHQPTDDEPPSLAVSTNKAKILRRRASWIDSYSFTWHQTYFINRYINGFEGQPPLRLDNAEAGETIRQLCQIVSAPEHAVRELVQNAEAARLRELEKAAHKIKKRLRNKELDDETRASLAQKAADAKAAREAKWEDLVQKVHSDPLSDALAVRLRRVRTQFLQATGRNTEKWEREILKAVHEADMATAVQALTSKQARQFNWPPKLPGSAPSPPPIPSAPVAPLPAPPIASNPPEKSIASLIAGQPPLVVEKTRTKGKNRRQHQSSEPAVPLRAESAPPAESQAAPIDPQLTLLEVNEPAPPVQDNESAPPVENSGPRIRFHWNRDYDELAKDAFAIMNSRCRSRGKLDYGAIKQVFPGVKKNNVRVHVKQMRESSPAMAAYMSRLEDRWHELWLKYRGSPFLPDDDPLGLKFDLIAHIEFLRKHVDKNALRVGFVEKKEEERHTIPGSVEELVSQFNIVETANTGSAWDFMWSTIVDEGREKRALRQPFTTRQDNLVLGTENASEEELLAESVLKMVMSTAQDSYDASAASEMLHSVGQETVASAQKNLLNRGVLAKRFKNPNSRPGRMLKISEGNQNAIGGSILQDTFNDARALEEISTQDQSWREWPLLSTDGDTAALIQLVSDNKVYFKIDTTLARAARAAIDWNSKKADDDDIETALLVRFHDITIPQTPSAPALTLAPMEVETVTEHGTAEDGLLASCKRVNEDSLIDCAACLEEEWGALYASIGHEDRDNFQLILDVVTRSGPKGITKRKLLAQTGLLSDAAFAAVRSMSEGAVPLMFWAGYQSLVVVASSYARDWSVQTSKESMTRIFPRRWIDITGAKVMDLWEAATRAVMGVLVFHPGVTQAQLRWRLRSVYDRQEVNEVLRYLEDAQFVTVRGGPLPAEDEGAVYFFVGPRHWYQA